MSASVRRPAQSGADGARQRSPEPGRKAAQRRPGRIVIAPAEPADYTAIYYFLTAVFQRPARDEFRAALEDPFHEPRDRVLAWSGSRIAGHAHVTRRSMQFGSGELPVAGLHDLGVLPELRGRGCGSELLAAAEARMAADGALVGLLWTRSPHFFRRHGWALCCRHCRAGATARDLLAGLETIGLNRRLNIRPWRRMELGALRRLYAQNLAGSFGPFHRSDAYWRWLVARRAFDQIYVALDGPDLLELEEDRAPIVGYAITRGEKILELFAAPGHFRAAAELLARACADAIERDHHTVILHAPPASRLDKLSRRAGARRADCSNCGCGVMMAKLLDPVRLIEELSGSLVRRADAVKLSLPTTLGLAVDGLKYQVAVSRDGVQVSTGHVGRSYLRLNVADFTRLLLGRLDWSRALAQGHVVLSTQLAAKTARALFRPAASPTSCARTSMMLATCNRFEILVDSPADVGKLEADVLAGAKVPLHQYRDADVVLHLLRVAVGLESVVLGEDQILGQVGEAFRQSESDGLLGRRLHKLWSRVMHVARKLRQTRPAVRGPRSVAELASRHARQFGPRIAIIGAGTTARTAAEALQSLDVRELWFANRTVAHAERLASHFGGRACSIDDLLIRPPDVDAAVIAISGRKLQLPVNRMPSLQAVVDVSQPAVAIGLDQHPHVHHLDLDGLAGLEQSAGEQMAIWREHVSVAAANEATRIYRELTRKSEDLGQLIGLHVENASAEVERALRGRLRGLDDSQAEEVRRLAERVARRNAHLHLHDVKHFASP